MSIPMGRPGLGLGLGLGTLILQANLIILPLLVLGYVLLGWLDADDALKRRNALVEANIQARRLEAAAEKTIEARAQALFERIETVRHQSNPAAQLRQLIYTGELSYLLIQRGRELVFPAPDDWTFANVEDHRRPLLVHAAALHASADPPQGWYADALGSVFFRCKRLQEESLCLALHEAVLRPDLVAALESAASGAPAWTFALRDSHDRPFWQNGTSDAAQDSFVLGGALKGWTLNAARIAAGPASAIRVAVLGIPLGLLWAFFVISLHRQRRDELAQAARKKAFFDKIAHDLRTPLANVKLYCDLVDQEVSEAGAAHCAVLRAEVDRLDQVAANAMAFGRTQAPQRRVAVPDDIVQSVLERFSPRLGLCAMPCTIRASEMTPLLFDVSGFERILVNLIDNACKYARGPLGVATRFDAGLLALEVSDAGPGLPQAAAPAGAGLGLSIVRELAAANGGTVRLNPSHQGLQILVTLQAKTAEAS